MDDLESFHRLADIRELVKSLFFRFPLFLWSPLSLGVTDDSQNDCLEVFQR